MKKHAPVQYTIRGIPAETDAALRRKAAQKHISLNELIVEELTAASGASRRRVDISDILGKWTPDSQFDEIIQSQRQIDWNKWK